MLQGAQPLQTSSSSCTTFALWWAQRLTLRFAYRSGIGVEDAVIYVLQRSHSHLQQAGSTVRVMFLIPFSLHWWKEPWIGQAADCVDHRLPFQQTTVQEAWCLCLKWYSAARRRHRAQFSHLFCLTCTLYTSGTIWTTALSRSSQMIRPSSDTYQMGMTRNIKGSSVTLSVGVRPTLSK